MADIAPALYERILAEYRQGIEADVRIAAIRKRMEAGSVRLTDHHTFAQAAGENLSAALERVLTPEALPNGRLYYNIADKTLRPALAQSAEEINKAGLALQAALDAKSGIQIKARAAKLPEDRLRGLVKKAADAEEAYAKWLREPVINFSEHMADAFARENAAFRREAGFRPTVRRILAPRCCDWCADVAGAGEYDYGQEPPDFWRRHEYCRCVVICETQRGRLESAWTKEIFRADRETLEERERLGSEEPARLSPEQARSIQDKLLERDKERAAVRKSRR